MSAGDPRELRRGANRAVRELFARLARRHHVVLFIDDLHWADEESARLLEDLLAAPDAPRILLVASFRTEEMKADSLLMQVLDRLSPLLVEVGELSEDESKQLADRLLSSRPDAIHSVVAECCGHPYLLVEMARASSEEQAWSGLSLEEALWRRVQRLPTPARMLLEMLAVAGHPLEREVALHAAGAPANALGTLRTRHLTRSAGAANRVTTYHDRLREAIVARLSPEVKQARHRTLAEVLERLAQSDAETLVLHWGLAGEPRRAAQHAPAAAQQAEAALAFERAARLYELALETHDDAELRIRLAETLVAAGHGGEAAPHYLRAATYTHGEEAAELRRKAAHELLCSGNFNAGLEVLDALMREHSIHLPHSTLSSLPALLLRRTWLTVRGLGFKEHAEADVPRETLLKIDLCWSAVVGLSMVDTVRAAELQTLHASLALAAGEVRRILRAVGWEVAFCSGFRGSEAIVQRAMEACETLRARFTEPETQGMVDHVIGVGVFVAGDWTRATDHCERAIAHLRGRPGQSWLINNAWLWILISDFYRGNLTRLAQAVPEQLKVCQEQGDLYHEVTLSVRFSWILDLMADRPDDADATLTHVMDRWSQDHGFHVQHWYRWLGVVETALYQGRPDVSWDRVEAARHDIQKSFSLQLQICHIISLDLEARVALAMAQREDREHWLHKVEHHIHALMHDHRDYGEVMARLLQAGVQAARGHEAHSLYASAALHADAIGMRMHALVARYRMGDEKALATLAAQGVAAPEKWMDLLAPPDNRTTRRRG